MENARDARYVTAGYCALRSRRHRCLPRLFDSSNPRHHRPGRAGDRKGGRQRRERRCGGIRGFRQRDAGVFRWAGIRWRHHFGMGWIGGRARRKRLPILQRLPGHRKTLARMAGASSTSCTTGSIWQRVSLATFWIFRPGTPLPRRDLTFGGVNCHPNLDTRWAAHYALLGCRRPLRPALFGNGRMEAPNRNCWLATEDAPTTADSWSSASGVCCSTTQAMTSVKPRTIWVLPVSGGVAGKPSPLHESVAFESDAQNLSGRTLGWPIFPAETGKNEALSALPVSRPWRQRTGFHREGLRDSDPLVARRCMSCFT